MKKIYSILTLIFQIIFFCSCTSNELKKIQLNKYNIYDYLNIYVEYENQQIKVTTSSVSNDYMFWEYTGIELFLTAETVFDYDDVRKSNFDISLCINTDGSCTYDYDDYLGNYQAIVFNEDYISTASGYVYLNGSKVLEKGGIKYLTNEVQQKIYTELVNEIPKPGDDAYSSEGCLYKFLDKDSRLALYSAVGGDIISASISKKNNNAKVTELGDGSPLLYSPKGNNNTSIKSIKLSKYTERINDYALEFAKNLLTISLPDTMKHIGKNTFFCANLSNGINLPKGLTTIDNFAFYNTNLTSIIIPNTVTYVGKFAFQSCENITIYVESGTNTNGWHYDWDILEERTTLGDVHHNVIYL